MTQSRKTYKSLGVVPIVFLILYGFANQYIITPLQGKLWSLALMTTPDGFISEKNLLNTLIKSPWILLIALFLIVMYLVISIWPISAVVVGIGYARQGKKIMLRDLIRVSLHQIGGFTLKDDWMMIIYALIILPMANVYQTSDLVGSFIIPEYILDFIKAKTVLFILLIIILVFLVYLALKWIFILPSFILKKKDFKEAKAESRILTDRCFVKNGINYLVYFIIEFVRLSLIPIALILIPVFICYVCTQNFQFANSIYNAIGITIGLEVAQNITGTLVEISSMCFVVMLYFEKHKELGADDTVLLPELEEEGRSELSITRFQVIMCSAFAIIIACLYLLTVNTARKDNSILLELFGKTEIIAHKGYSSKAPENTMPAFKMADDNENVSYIELDVWSSKDGVPVVIHNETITDATGIEKKIYECTYEELQKIPAPYHWSEKDFPDARIPGLEEVIATYENNTPLIIEIKGYTQDPQLPAKIVGLMKKYGCENTSVIHSGNYEALKTVKQIDPDIKCGLILAMVTGDCYDLPYADFFSIEHTFVDQAKVADIHRRGKEVYAWTVNYDTSAENLRFSDVDGLITDVPDDIFVYVADRNNLIDDVLTVNRIGAVSDEISDLAMQRYEYGEY